MTRHYGIETVGYHAGIRVTCRIPDASYGWRHGEVIVEDTKTGVRLALPRHEWTPLLKAIRHALRSASEALEVVPIDPVVRAVARVPVKSYPAALARGAILSKYHEDLNELRQTYMDKADSLRGKLVGPDGEPPLSGPYD